MQAPRGARGLHGRELMPTSPFLNAGHESQNRCSIHPKVRGRFQLGPVGNRGAYIVTNTIVGVPYYNYSIMGPQTLF